MRIVFMRMLFKKDGTYAQIKRMFRIYICINNKIYETINFTYCGI